MSKLTEIKHTCYKGTRILLGDKKRDLINSMIELLKKNQFQEISIPVIQYTDMFTKKVGEENNNLMFTFKDRGERDICLAPEYTAVIQNLASHNFKHIKDFKVFYVQECFRGEKPQEGRYRQFTQLGVEIMNPTRDYLDYLIGLARSLLFNQVAGCSSAFYQTTYTPNLKVNSEVVRGLDYYKDGKGFEISYELLGSQKQICGGGEYQGGVGFAIGIDRVLLINS